MRTNYTSPRSTGDYWIGGIGDSHVQCTGTAQGLMYQLARVLNEGYGCSVRTYQRGLSGDTTHVSSGHAGIRERFSSLFAPTRVKPTIILLEGGVNNLSNSLTNADITADFKSMIRAARNGVFPLTSSTSRALTSGTAVSPSAAFQNGIVTDISLLPSGCQLGTLMLVTADDGTSDGVNYDLTGAAISNSNPTTQGFPYNRKQMSGATSTDSIWVCAGNGQSGKRGWYRTFSEEQIAAGGYFTYVPYIRYFVIEGLHLYYGSESNGSAAAANTLVRTAQQNTVTDLEALSNSPYNNGSGRDLIYVDTFTPMANLITTASPAADPAQWSYYPSGSDNHLGADGNEIVAGIIAAAMKSKTNYDGITWTQMLGGAL